MSKETDDLKGRTKEAAGDLTDDESLKREGKLDRAASSVKDKANKAKHKVEEVVDRGRDKASES